jgi:dCMP deaminase
MGLAVWMSERSKDPNTQVGACIVDNYNIPVGLGYNGFPRKCKDTLLPWDREGDFLDTKYPYVAHAEENAIDNSSCDDLHGCRIYCTLFPCNRCAIRIIQNGIIEVVYLSDEYHDEDMCVASRKLFDLAGVKTRQMIIDKTYTIQLKSR